MATTRETSRLSAVRELALIAALFLVVVATGNHYWLDALAAATLLAAAYALLRHQRPAEAAVLPQPRVALG